MNEDNPRSDSMDQAPDAQSGPQAVSEASHEVVSREHTLSANWLDHVSVDDRHCVRNELNAIKLGAQMLRLLPEVVDSPSASFAVNEIEKAIETLTPTHRPAESGGV